MRSRVRRWLSARAFSSYLRFSLDIVFTHDTVRTQIPLNDVLIESEEAMMTAGTAQVIGPADGKQVVLGARSALRCTGTRTKTSTASCSRGAWARSSARRSSLVSRAT